MRWNARRAICGFAGLTLVSLGGCSSGDTDASAQRKDLVPVKAVSVTQQDVPRRTVQPATVHAYYTAEIRTRVSGYVKQLKADIGDHVHAGDVLAVIDVPDLEKRRQTLQATIRRRQAEEKRASAGVDLATAMVQSARAKLEQAKSEMSRVDASVAAAEAEFSRTNDLVERQSLQQRVLDEVRKKRDSELASKDSVSSAIISAEADVVVAQAQRASAEADSDAARSETEIARSQLEELDVLIDYATLRAPFTGVVASRSVDPGDLVREESQGSKGPSLFVLSQIDKVRIHTPVPEAEAALVNPGDEILLSLPSFPGEKEILATVTRASGSLDPSTRTMLVEAEMENAERKLLPGMFGQASITLGTKVAANILPARAIRFDESGQAYVYVIGADDTVSVVNVTTGLDDGRMIEVTSGVESGQRVVDAHLKRFTSGQKVTLLTN
jgi:RND family efflux transporter MFP subunit